MSLSVCIMCREVESKYKCPQCCGQTCSSSCFKRHKSVHDCQGKRRNYFAHHSELLQVEAFQDAKFIEKAECVLNSAKSLMGNLTADMQEINCEFDALAERCRFEGTQLIHCPAIFSKRKTNTSYFNEDLDTIFWQVRWIFADCDGVYFEGSGIPDTASIQTLFLHYDDDKRRQFNSVKWRRLTPYFRPFPGLTGVRCFLETITWDNRYNMQHRLAELDIEKTLRENFSGKCISERPFIYVILNRRDSLSKLKAQHPGVITRATGHFVRRRSLEAQAELYDLATIKPGATQANGRVRPSIQQSTQRRSVPPEEATFLTNGKIGRKKSAVVPRHLPLGIVMQPPHTLNGFDAGSISADLAGSSFSESSPFRKSPDDAKRPRFSFWHSPTAATAASEAPTDVYNGSSAASAPTLPSASSLDIRQ